MRSKGESELGGAAAIYAIWREKRGDNGVSFEELCAAHPELEPELRRIHAADRLVHDALGARSSFADAAEATGEAPFGDLLVRLREHAPPRSRYEERGPLGRGGMGEVREVYDVDLRRSLAKKQMLARGAGRGTEDASVLGRFVQEAQVTAQLSHPGVVPVHELGVDEAGRVFFTMERVGGRTLGEVFELAREGSGEWTLARAVGVLERVCETIAFAHSRGVLHRDLKPANVMVGEFGEVYVLDWGLAKLLGPGSERPEGGEPTRLVSTDRRDASDRDLLAAYTTRPGTVAGSFGFMSPEQTRGEVEALDERADVFSIGALLYTLIAGRCPYAKEIEAGDAIRTVAAMREGSCDRLAEIAPDAPLELVSIAEKAMATEREQRYPSALELAADLRAWLEGRVVLAHERGAWAELRKWVLRNKAFAASLAFALAAVLAGVSGMAVFERSRRRAIEIAAIQGAPATMAGLWTQAEEIWPSTPDRAPELARWLENARSLAADRNRYEAAFAALHCEPSRYQTTELDARIEKPLEGLLARIDQLPSRLAWVERRFELANTIEERTLTGTAARERWRTAIESIGSLDAYDGLELTPQLGLLPLRQDPESGLWEFWHVLSGEEPRVDPETGRWRVEAATGVVLVLIPRGTYGVGTPEVPRGDPLYDEWARPEDSDPFERSVLLQPYFISKYELTRAQWTRATLEDPSAAPQGELTCPADSVSWNRCAEVLARLDLTLPTEAQWEAAARAGKRTRFYTGQDSSTLAHHVNLLPDRDGDYEVDTDANGRPVEVYGTPWESRPLPVGSFEPNPFGLHDVHGNVWEWCLDVFDFRDPLAAPRPGDGLRLPANLNAPSRVMRGGAFQSSWMNARLSYRYPWEPSNREPDTGVRPARALR